MVGYIIFGFWWEYRYLPDNNEYQYCDIRTKTSISTCALNGKVRFIADKVEPIGDKPHRATKKKFKIKIPHKYLKNDRRRKEWFPCQQKEKEFIIHLKDNQICTEIPSGTWFMTREIN